MADFKNGVRWFLRGKLNTHVDFPEGIVKCQYCPFLYEEKGLGRYWCRITNNMLYNPFVLDLPQNCPIELTGEIIGEREVG